MIKIDYFELWKECKKGTIATMYNNLADDLRAGYDPFGNSAIESKHEIAIFEVTYLNTLKNLSAMNEECRQKYCKNDLKSRGWI